MEVLSNGVHIRSPQSHTRDRFAPVTSNDDLDYNPWQAPVVGGYYRFATFNSRFLHRDASTGGLMAMDDTDDFFSAAEADLLRGLNPGQAEAVQHIEGPLMILAGPGSGKTRVITHRIAYMIQQGIPADRILALTFTNKAANELGNRIQQLVPGTFVWAGTFHRFCSRLLRQYGSFVGLKENFSILDMDDAGKLFSQAYDLAGVNDSFVSSSAVQAEISKAKNALIMPEEYQARAGHVVGRVVEKVYPVYQRKLLACNAVDFDDLLLWVAVVLKENEELRERLDERFAYIMVDEYQDTNLAQYAIVRGLSNRCPNLAVTGDPDQSIYGWRGANIGNILGFERDFPAVQVVRLEQNYRSTQTILQVADRLIGHNRLRKQKRLIPTKEIGEPVRLKVSSSPQDEADWIASEVAQLIAEGIWEPKDIAVFYRANWLSRNLEHEFTSVGVPYQLVNGFEFYQRKEVKDLVAYMRLIVNPQNDVALERVINSPARKIGKVTLDRIRAIAQQQGISLLEACHQVALRPAMLGRGGAPVKEFVEQINELHKVPWESVKDVLEAVLDVTGYAEILEADQSEVSSERLGNIDELLVAADEYDKQHLEEGGLEAYLETAALVSDTDKMSKDANQVKMMTMHAAKGLEFPVVYIVGLEEGILPHERSMEDSKQVEEERRLFFVGITRAQNQLTLCQCEGRMRRGSFSPSPASSFLAEVRGPDLEYVRISPQFHAFPKGGLDLRPTPRTQKRDWVADECGGQSIPMDDALDGLNLPPEQESPVRTASFEAADYRRKVRTPNREPSEDSDFDTVQLDATDFDSDDADGCDEFDSIDAPFPPKSTLQNKSGRGPRPSSKTAPPKPEKPGRETSDRRPLPNIGLAAAMFAADRPDDKAAEAGPDSLGTTTNQVSAEKVFQVGGLVQHPEYGPGKVVALDGAIHKQMVTVYFFSVGQKKFRAKFCDLKPLPVNPK